MYHSLPMALAVPAAKCALLFFLLGMIGGFAGARLHARLKRATGRRWLRSLCHGDLHIHHVVYGVVIMMVSGVLIFALASDTGWRTFLAFCFGGGTGMVLDEFALILHLEDVYWAEAGRKSVEVAILTAAATLMLLFGFMPFGGGSDVLGPRSGWTVVGIVAINLVAVVVASLKGKRLLAALGVFVPFVALLGALGVARPDSPWARRLYGANSAKFERAQRRALLVQARQHRMLDLVAGTPSRPSEE